MQIWTDNSRVNNYLIIDNYREISENVKLNINDATLPLPIFLYIHPNYPAIN